MHFNEFKLDDKILQAIEQLGYTEPTEVQQKVIPVALSKKDILVKSKTGSGKTAAVSSATCVGHHYP